jgi:ubiquinone biosynthesis protein Coq4
MDQDSNKDEIADCKSDLQHAICNFNVSLHNSMCVQWMMLKNIQVQAMIVSQNDLQAILVGQGTIMNMLGMLSLYELPSTL